MTFVDDDAIRRLRESAEWPDLSHTKYDAVRRVARGGMGVIYVAWDHELKREVALKVLSISGQISDAGARMSNEARVLAQLDHPGIVPIYDAGTLPDGREFYTMKLVRGKSIDHHLASPSAGLTEIIRVFVRVCEAVAFAHSRGVVHRDLKPSNIMVGSFGEVLVMDWGVAKMIGRLGTRNELVGEGRWTNNGTAEHGNTRDDATDPGTVIGTVGYMAPEQARGEVDRIDHRTDVFALGAILRNLVDAVDDSIPKRLAALYAKAMSRNPESRYQSVALLESDVSRFLAGDAVKAYRESVWDRTTRVAMRHRTPILLVVAYLVMRMLLIIFGRT